MASINNIVLMTELDAVNYMLAAVGESPITNVDTATQGDVAVAIDTLRDVVAEVQSRGWKYNVDLQYRIAVGTSGDDLDKFVVPAGLIRFDTDLRHDQVGPVPFKQEDGTFASDPITHLDLTIKKDPVDSVKKFYHRIENRFNFGDATTKPQIFITVVWFRDFEDQPETARRYQAIRAARKFTKRITQGEGNLANDMIEEELTALKELQRDQGWERKRSFLENTFFARALGGRPRFGVRIR